MQNDVMNVIYILSRDVEDLKWRHFALINIKVPKAQDVKTPSK